MPQESPSISATVVDAEAIVSTDATAVIPIRVVTTPMIALRIGMPAAAKAPNVIIRMMNATSRPTSSGVSEIFCRQSG